MFSHWQEKLFLVFICVLAIAQASVVLKYKQNTVCRTSDEKSAMDNKITFIPTIQIITMSVVIIAVFIAIWMNRNGEPAAGVVFSSGVTVFSLLLLIIALFIASVFELTYQWSDKTTTLTVSEQEDFNIYVSLPLYIQFGVSILASFGVGYFGYIQYNKSIQS